MGDRHSERLELELSEGDNYLCIFLEQRDWCGMRHNGYPDLNLIQLCYNQADSRGWGTGDGEFILTTDVAAMATGLCSVFSGTRESYSYTCEERLIKVYLKREAPERFTFEVSMMETLMWEYYITVRKEGLSPAELKEYIDVFTGWKKQFPEMPEEALVAYQQAVDCIFCLSRSLGEPDIKQTFNRGVETLLGTNNRRFTRIMNRIADLQQLSEAAPGTQKNTIVPALQELFYRTD